MFRITIQSLAFAVVALCSIPGTGSAYAQGSDSGLAQQLTNPLANLISVPIQTNYDDGYGSRCHFGPDPEPTAPLIREIGESLCQF
jgi:hypothetical protein